MAILTHDQLEAAEWAALKVLGNAAAEQRDSFQEGEVDVDTLLRIKGKVRVGKTTEGTRLVKPSPEKMLAATLQFLGSKIGDKITESLVEELGLVIGDHKYVEETQEGYLAVSGSVVKHASTFLPQTKRGAVSGILTVGEVELDKLTATVSKQIAQATRAIMFAEEEAKL